jgi:uncharacterized membrane protein
MFDLFDLDVQVAMMTVMDKNEASDLCFRLVRLYVTIYRVLVQRWLLAPPSNCG